MSANILESEVTVLPSERPPRLVAADLDGTLLLSDSHELSPLTVRAVQTLRAMDIPTILVTGRMFSSAERFARQLSLEGPLAAYQGALIRELSSGEVLHHDPLPLELAWEILEFVEGGDCPVNVYVDDTLFVAKKDFFVERYETISGMTAHVVGDLRSFLDRAPTKIGMGGEPDAVSAVLEQLRGRFSGRANALKTWPFFLELTSPSATKSRALQLLGERLGFEAADVLAFGDSYNDADMLVWAGTGVATADAPAEVSAVADHVCASVDEDGFARYLAAQPWFPAGALEPHP